MKRLVPWVFFLCVINVVFGTLNTISGDYKGGIPSLVLGLLLGAVWSKDITKWLKA